MDQDSLVQESIAKNRSWTKKKFKKWKKSAKNQKKNVKVHSIYLDGSEDKKSFLPKIYFFLCNKRHNRPDKFPKQLLFWNFSSERLQVRCSWFQRLVSKVEKHFILIRLGISPGYDISFNIEIKLLKASSPTKYQV